MSLWKRITNAVKPVLKTVAPIAAAAIPGVGKIAVPLLAGAVSRGSAQVQTAVPVAALIGPPAMPGTGYGGGEMVQTAGAVGQVIRGGAGALARSAGAGAIGRGAAKLVIQGKRVSLNTLKRLVKSLGPEAVALALGMTVANLAQVMFDMEPKGRRRRRGISYSDVSRVRRVLRKFKSMQSLLADSCPPRRTYRRTTKTC